VLLKEVREVRVRVRVRVRVGVGVGVRVGVRVRVRVRVSTSVRQLVSWSVGQCLGGARAASEQCVAVRSVRHLEEVRTCLLMRTCVACGT
jgi:hypothetical protein